MRVVLQRVAQASVCVKGQIHGQISKGYLILIGVTHDDSLDDIEWLVNKIVGLRVFNDQQGKMNLNIKDVNGELLVVSQFTLHASVKKGNRPSFIKAAKPDLAIPLYEAFVSALSRKLTTNIQTGVFGADMKVSLVNDGPVTILIDSKNRE